MSIFLLIDAFAPAWHSPALALELCRSGYRPNYSLVQYGDDDMSSPSCSEWIIPNSVSLY